MQNKKVAFVTGGNRGIGFETARELAEKGVSVVIGSRDQVNGEAQAKRLQDKGYEVKSIPFDVNKASDHQRAYDFFEKNYGHLDILVNNAGVAVGGWDASASNRASGTPADILRQTFETNFFGLVSLTQKLLPLIRKSPAGRIVNLSSILGSLTLHSDPSSPIYNSKTFAYNASKTALNAFTVDLAHELKGTSIKVNSAHPGWVKTAMGGENAPMEVKDGSKTSVQLALLPENGPTGGFFHLGETLPW